MEIAATYKTNIMTRETAAMGELKSHVPELLAKTGWSPQMFIGQCLIVGISQDTAYRLMRGETNFTTDTLKLVANVFGVASISEVMDLSKNGEK